MTRRAWTLLPVLLGLALSLPAAESAPEAGVVEIQPAANDEGTLWKPVEDARGGTAFAAALGTWLLAHPHGVQASRALLEQAGLQDNLIEAGATLRRARGEGPGSVWGARASLELAKLEYAQERTESALMALEDAETWPRPEGLELDWLYWRGQCRLVLKGFERAKADFEQVTAVYRQRPKGAPEAPGRSEQVAAAQLGLAECDAALKLDDKALAGFEALYQDPQGAFGAQALWGAATLRQRQGSAPEARALFQRLRMQYPASFEAKAAQSRLQELDRPPLGKPALALKPRARAAGLFVQVRPYSKRGSAVLLQKKLKARRYPVLLEARRHPSRTLYHVKVGPYKDRAAAEAAAHKLKAQDHLASTPITED